MPSEFEKPQRYSKEAAREEADKMNAKIESGEASDLGEAEELVKDDVLYEAINETTESFEVDLINAYIAAMKIRGLPAESVKKVELAFEEFVTVQRKLMDELKGDYSSIVLRRQIPNNLCLKVIEKAGAMLSELYGSDPEDKEENREAARDYILELAEKKKRKIDKH